MVTIKASYKGDIVRFRVPCSAGVAAAKEEVVSVSVLDVLSDCYAKFVRACSSQICMCI